MRSFHSSRFYACGGQGIHPFSLLRLGRARNPQLFGGVFFFCVKKSATKELEYLSAEG
jgi:hypothetical protein